MDAAFPVDVMIFYRDFAWYAILGRMVVDKLRSKFLELNQARRP